MSKYLKRKAFVSTCRDCDCVVPLDAHFQFDTNDWMDDQELMQLFRISPATLFRMKKRRELPFIRLCGKTLFNKVLVYSCILFRKKCNEIN